jgi:prepilin-type N-terminal cleavage/methylation domain-containing protein
MTMRLHTQRGFTLVELMIVVALIAVLAAVVIPSFFQEASRVKAETEVSAVFAELRIREEQAKVETGQYQAVAAHPAGPSPSLQDFQTTMPTDWIALRFAAPTPKVRCSYSVSAGLADTAVGSVAEGFGMAATPAINWWFALATCDLDGSSTKNGVFFTSSQDTRIQSTDPSH